MTIAAEAMSTLDWLAVAGLVGIPIVALWIRAEFDAWCARRRRERRGGYLFRERR